MDKRKEQEPPPYLATNAEELNEVMELPMHITTHGDGAWYGLHIRLFGEDFLGLFAKDLDLR